MYKATSDSKVEVVKDDIFVAPSNASSDNISSLNPNQSDKGLKRTLKARHLSVSSLGKQWLLLILIKFRYIFTQQRYR